MLVSLVEVNPKVLMADGPLPTSTGSIDGAFVRLFEWKSLTTAAYSGWVIPSRTGHCSFKPATGTATLIPLRDGLRATNGNATC
jgi:hypothetical protein